MSIELEKSFYPITIKVSSNKSSSDIILTRSLFYTPPKESKGSKSQAVKGEAVKGEAVNVETVKAQPVKVEAINVEAIKTGGDPYRGMRRYDDDDDDDDDDNYMRSPRNRLREKGGEAKESSSSSTSSSPFYTDEKMYPLTSVSANKKKDSYFDAELFEKILGDVDYDISKEAKYANSKFNVMQMLETLFPTSLPNHLNVNTSHDLDNLKTASTTATGTWLPTWFTGYFQNVDTSKYSYVSIGGKKYTVVGVLWKNNVLKHPIYSRFFKDIMALDRVKHKEVAKLKKEIQTLNAAFTTARSTVRLSRKETEDAIDSLKQYRYSSRKTIYLTGMQKSIETFYSIQRSGTLEQVRKELFKLYLLEKDSSRRDYSILPSEIRNKTDLMNLIRMATNIEIKQMMLDYIDDPAKRSQIIREMKHPDTKDDSRFKFFQEDFSKVSYGKIVSQIQRSISNIRSSNYFLQDLIDSFIKGTYNDDELLELATKITRNKISEISNIQILDTGVVNMTPVQKDKSKSVSTPKYEISIALELLDYVVDDKTIGKVNCSYRNNLLMRLYLQNTVKRRGGNKKRTIKYRGTK